MRGPATLPLAFIFVTVATLSSLTPDRAPLQGNTTVTVLGNGFTTSDTVMFGTLAGQVTFLDRQTLEVVTPPHGAGVVDVTVTSPAGSDTLLQSFTFLPPPTLIQLTPTEGDFSGGTLVTIAGTNLSVLGDVTVNFGSAIANVLDVLAGASILVQAPPVALPGPVNVTVICPVTC